MINVLPMLVLLSSAASADEMQLGERLLSEVPIVSDGGARIGETSFREIALTVGEKTSHAVQTIVRDPATGLFWTLIQRGNRPLTAVSIRDDFTRHRFAIAGGKMIVFRLQGSEVLVFSSRRKARSLASAVTDLDAEVRRELATTWPITGALPDETAIRSVSLSSALPWQFLVDAEFHPVPYRLSIDSFSFIRGRWDLALRNEKGAVEHLYFSQSLKPVSKK